MAFSPVEASKHITEKYSRYLHTIFSIDDEDYNRQLQSQLEGMDLLAAGPYLDVTDSFEKGSSLEDLIQAGKIVKSFRKVNIPLTRPLYKHQEIAINKVLDNHNLIVSTGTGSGKTESFLIPVLNHIIREYEAGTLDDGVRALLVYPMNALANDQIERLRELLADFPEITYGSYTGQTKRSYKEAISEYLQLNENRNPAANELICRDQMKETPPHILITNYAMLEYLMVRPGDKMFFSEENSQKWKFIVLDEAHVYNGSSGIEVSMLLRRLKAKLDNSNINYILTSATLGDKDSDEDVAAFGEKLCDSHFNVSDIVRAYRKTPKADHEQTRLPVEFYVDLAERIENDGIDEELNSLMSSCVDYDSTKTVEENLYDIILHDENYAEIKAFAVETKTIQLMAQQMGWTEQELTSFVTVASKAEKNGDRLFDARYHMFLRATESVFITLSPSKKLFMTRKRRHIENDGKDYAVFEISTCSACHAIYIIGTIRNDYLMQSSFQNEDELKSVFLLKSEISDTDTDHTMEEENIAAEEYELCPRCGFIRRAGLAKNVCCEHNQDAYVKVFRVHLTSEKGNITKCLACENTNSGGILRMFFTGQEAVTSVVGTALFEELPAYKLVRETVEEDDSFGFGFGGDVSVTQTVSEAKQFIAFSDNRQAAAFYATYLDQTYHQILYKRLLVECLKGYREGWKGKTVPEFVNDLSATFEEYNIASKGVNQSIREAWKAVLKEAVDNNGITSLYNMGLVSFSLNPTLIPANPKLGMSAAEVCDLCNVFALGMMADAAIYYDFSMNRTDREFFAHGGVEYRYTLSDPDTQKYQRSFIPRFVGKTNKRADYFKRVLEKMGREVNDEMVNKLLEAIWNYIFVKNSLIKPAEGAYRINSDNLMITRPQKWYRCTKCRGLTAFNVHGICPSYKCSGELKEVDLEKIFQDNHYYRIYQDLDIRDLRVVEHTAQLGKEKAYEYQRKFKQKEIDILSCSTTFEMGVDVGSLETVFMRNMPPSPANYAQRAGRAGRSKNAAAFALTFCNKSNHDFNFFANPVQMIKGRIDPPRFVVENEKIAIRHIYASALAFFWDKYPDYFSTAAGMTEKNDDGIRGADAFTNYLLSKPEDLKEFLLRFLPKKISSQFDIENYGWLDRLIGDGPDNPGVLTKAVADYDYEVEILKKAREEAFKADNKVDRLSDRIHVYQREDILSFLSRKNVMPKYGFPVDTVEMLVNGKGENAKMGLQLSRDLAIAISEYAPGSQVVANGNLFTSRYIRKMPQMSWKMYDYIHCDCRTMNIAPHVDDADLSELCTCRQCKKDLVPSRKKTFIVPEFGFEADGNKIEKPGLKKPDRTYRGEVSYVGFRKDLQVNKFSLGKSIMEYVMSNNDEMAVTNDSNFFVCESCGYTDMDEKRFTSTKKHAHKTSYGADCNNNLLKRFSLGYRFETDVFQWRFLTPEIVDFEDALSILFGLIRGIETELNIEEGEIAGCIQYYCNPYTKHENYSMVFYDRTPGGAGHVRRLASKDVLENILKTTLRLMESCTCGGEDKDSSCYQCLRDYYNQKYHDILSRKRVIDFVKNVLG